MLLLDDQQDRFNLGLPKTGLTKELQLFNAGHDCQILRHFQCDYQVRRQLGSGYCPTGLTGPTGQTIRESAPATSPAAPHRLA